MWEILKKLLPVSLGKTFLLREMTSATFSSTLPHQGVMNLVEEPMTEHVDADGLAGQQQQRGSTLGPAR
jgi:hypothetical protein